MGHGWYGRNTIRHALTIAFASTLTYPIISRALESNAYTGFAGNLSIYLCISIAHPSALVYICGLDRTTRVHARHPELGHVLRFLVEGPLQLGRSVFRKAPWPYLTTQPHIRI